MGYSRRTSNYPKRIALSDLTHMMSMARVGRSRSGTVFGTPFGPSLGLGLGPVSVHLGHDPVRS